VLTANTADSAYDGKIKNMVLTITSLASTQAVTVHTNPFTITFVDKCWGATLTAPVFDQASWTYDLWAA